MSIDLSLAKGLRNSVLRQLADKAASAMKNRPKALQRMTTLPSTEKGARVRLREILNVVSKIAILTYDQIQFQRCCYWVGWNLLHPKNSEGWEHDILTVKGVLHDLMAGGNQRTSHCRGNAGVTMHLIERVFQRLNTTDHKKVLDEVAMGLLIGEVLAQGFLKLGLLRIDREIPVMVPARTGVIVGDLCHKFGCDFLLFRTFIGGHAQLTGQKKKLADALNPWADKVVENMHDWMCLLMLHPDHEYQGNEELWDGVVSLAKEYLSIVDQYPGALTELSARNERLGTENTHWNLAMTAKAQVHHAATA